MVRYFPEIEALGKNDAVKVIIIAAEGKGFVPGLILKNWPLMVRKYSMSIEAITTPLKRYISTLSQ